ncbi:isochorismatase [Xylaria bambusicola]|uniref:isochorismatase n=1 Tax=Xylaria bambusicola TaxID=326684 RepID=UPI002008A8E7|nr:isochorismatase [Xylaria bambusicola]KAI0517158.1 isochorismatase [Xylaria bambusicola]
MTNEFRPALIVVDVQEDFCPPNGSLAVPGGRDIVAPINKLLDLPFVLKVATKDWHPQDHISFAANHAGKQPFVDFATVVNPDNAAESYSTRLWPVHCVQGSRGAALLPELETDKLDEVLEKGTDRRVEMYSPFYDPFRTSDSGLAGLLRAHAVTDVYVVGLAGDYCVKACAEDAAKEGFRTYLIEECTRAVDAGAWPLCRRTLEEGSRARVVSLDGPEVLRLSQSLMTAAPAQSQ